MSTHSEWSRASYIATDLASALPKDSAPTALMQYGNAVNITEKRSAFIRAIYLSEFADRILVVVGFAFSAVRAPIYLRARYLALYKLNIPLGCLSFPTCQR